MEYRAVVGGKEEGPLTFGALRALVAEGTLRPHDRVWADGPDWVRAEDIPGLFLGDLEVPVVVFHPWFRYAARHIDLCLFFLPCGFFAGMLEALGVLPHALGPTDHPYLFGIASGFLWCFVEALLLSICGATFGKWLLHVRVRHADGSKLSYGTAFMRAFDVFGRGTGLEIPLVSAVTQIASYNRLKRRQPMPWDAENGLVVTHRSVSLDRRIAAWAVLLLIAALTYHGKLGF